MSTKQATDKVQAQINAQKVKQLTDDNRILRLEIVGARAATVREQYQRQVITQERDALRKVMIILAERCSVDSHPQAIAATFSPDDKQWQIAGQEAE